MTTPPPIQIGDETLQVARDALYEGLSDNWEIDSAAYRTGSRAVAEAVAPLIAAQVLREHTISDHCHPCDAKACAWIGLENGRERSSVEPARCGEPNPHKDGYVCLQPAGHVPEYDHRFGPGRSLTEDAP